MGMNRRGLCFSIFWLPHPREARARPPSTIGSSEASLLLCVLRVEALDKSQAWKRKRPIITRRSNTNSLQSDFRWPW